MMNRFKLIIFILLLFIPFTSLIAKKKQVTIHLDADFRPYSYVEDNEHKGVYYNILKSAVVNMKDYEVKFVSVGWSKGLKLMEEGKAFAMGPILYHGYDYTYIYPYSIGLYDETIIAICNEKVLLKERKRWPVDYIGLKIGNVDGYTGWGGEEFKFLVKYGKIQFEVEKDVYSNILKMGQGKLDCIISEEKAFDYSLRDLKEKGLYDEGGKHASLKKGAFIGSETEHLGYSKKARLSGKYPFQFDFMQALDNEIYKMKESGEIEQIINTYKY